MDAAVALCQWSERRPAILVVGGLAALAILVRASIQPFVGDTHQFVAAYAAMAAATWLCGWQAGVATAILCGLAGQLFPPVSELDHQLSHVALAHVAYFGVSIATVSAVEWLRRERLEAEEAGRRLRQAERRAAEFVAVVSHELRNPLTTLVQGIEVLGRRGAEAEEVARMVPLMRRQTHHMAKLLDDLLESSRLEMGGLRLQREPTDLLVAVQEAVLDVRAAVDEKRQRVTIIRDADPGTVFVDPARLRQILVNVLDNASKFSPENSQIHVVVSGREHWTSVSVSDEGAGLTPAQLQEIFEPFARAAAPAAPGFGLRIGLPLARRLARLHGGNLRAFSAGLDRGSEFLLSLPRGLPAPQSLVAAPHRGPAPVGARSAPGVT